MRHLSRNFGLFLVILSLVLCFSCAALAQEDWESLSVTLTYADESGESYAVMAYPLSWKGEEHAFWAQVPEGVEGFTLAVSHPLYPGYTFDAAGAFVTVNALRDTADTVPYLITAFNEEGNAAESYTLYVSVYDLPQEPEVLPATVSTAVIYRTEEGDVLFQQEVEITSDQPQTFARLPFDGYEPVDGTPESITVAVDAAGNLSSSPVFVYRRVHVPVSQDVTVLWQAADGTVLLSQTITITEGEPQTFYRNTFEDYEPDAETPESITVSVGADGSVTPAQPVFRFHAVHLPSSREVTAVYQTTDGTVLHTETITVTEGTPQTFLRLAIEGYEPEGETPEAITVNVLADGSVSPENTVFVYHPVVTLVSRNVTVRWTTVDGTILKEETVNITEGTPQTFVRENFEGYVPAEGTPENMTVAVNSDGTVTPDAPIFTYQPVYAPVTKDVTVYWLSGNTILSEQVLNLVEGQPQSVLPKTFDGYELDASAPSELVISVDGNGAVTPEDLIFTYHEVVKAPTEGAVHVAWMAEDTVLHEEDIVLAVGTAQEFRALDIEGYELDSESTPVITVSVGADGQVSPASPVFRYHAVHIPVTGEIMVSYIADGDQILYQQSHTLTEGIEQTFELLNFDGYLPDEGVPQAVTARVNADGSVEPGSIVFNYHTLVPATPVPPVTIPVHYVDKGGHALAPDQYVIMEAGTEAVLAPDLSQVPEDYDPASAASVAVQVSIDGIPSPDEIVFSFGHRETQETPIPAGNVINRWAETNAKGINIRTEPAKKGNAGTISKTGTKVYAIESVINSSGQSWTRILYNGTEGYISSEFLNVLSQAASEDYQDTLETPVPYMASIVTAPPAEITEEPVAEPTATALPTEIPETQAPVTEAPITEAPATEVPATEIPATEVPVTEAPATATPVPEQYTGYALIGEVVALRAEVSREDSAIMTTLPASTLVRVNGQVYNAGEAWSQVRTLDDLIGYVPDSTLRRINEQEADYYIRQYQEAHPTPSPAATETVAPVQITGYAYTIGDSVPFRNTYSDKSVILAELAQKTAVYVGGQVYDTEDGWPWHIVLHEGTWGYIRSDMLRMMTTQELNAYLGAAATAQPTQQVTAKPYDPDSLSSYGYIYASNNGAVNMRKTPSTKAEVLKRLRNYAFCLVLGKETIDQTEWYRVQYDGVIGYVSGSFFRQMSLAELEEFLDSKEYQQGIVNNTSAGATAAPVVSQEDSNVQTWTDPTSGLNVTYQTWAPFATTAPLPTMTATPVSTVSPEASPSVSPIMLEIQTPEVSPSVSPLALPTVEIEPIEEKTEGGFPFVPVILLVVIGGGIAYVFVMRRKNQKLAAERARQRKAQMARQQSANAPTAHPRAASYPNGSQQAAGAQKKSAQTQEPATAAQKPKIEQYKPVFPQNAPNAPASGQTGSGSPYARQETPVQAKTPVTETKPAERVAVNDAAHAPALAAEKPVVQAQIAKAVEEMPKAASDQAGENTNASPTQEPSSNERATGRRARRRAMEQSQSESSADQSET
ncbi:MAG: SH3 domain-containing protein [Clostridia bacterium]|nr:SH3 domain-containing protein [Clostridia bacterium]